MLELSSFPAIQHMAQQTSANWSVDFGIMRGENLRVMTKQLESLYLSGHYSDFVIVCGGQEFNVHKAIICPQSDFLKGLCGPLFKEGAEGKAVLQDVDPVLFEKAVRFLYTGSYVETSHTQQSPQSVTTTQSAKFDFSSEGFALVKRTPTQDTITIIEIGPGPGPAGQSLPRQIHEIPSSSTGDCPSSCNASNEPEVCEDEPALMLHIQMYVLADYLEIPLLKTEALHRFEAILSQEFNAERVLQPFTYALENTHPVHELRACILRLCSQNWRDVVEYTELDALLTREEPLTWKLLVDQEQRHARRLDVKTVKCAYLQDRTNVLEAELADLREELEACRDARERKDRKLNDCVRLTRQWQSCRNCRADFDAVLERHSRSGEFFLRCNRCQCKHDEY